MCENILRTKIGKLDSVVQKLTFILVYTAILLSLFWRRFNMAGCVSGIVAGALADCLYLIFCSKTGVYELVPGFFIGLIAAIAVALATKAPSEELNNLFDDAIKYTD